MGSQLSRNRAASTTDLKPAETRRRRPRWLSLRRGARSSKTTSLGSLSAPEPRQAVPEPRGPYSSADPSLPASAMAIEWKSAVRRAANQSSIIVEKNCNVLAAENSKLNIKSGKEAEDMTQEILQQIIRCFPFHPPKDPQSSQSDKLRRRSAELETHGPTKPQSRSRSLKAGNGGRKKDNNEPKPTPQAFLGNRSILKAMVLNSVDTMAITALPLDCWLRERLKHWCQLSGHAGTIVPATDSTLWKKRSGTDCNEATAYRALMNDILCPFVPKYHKEVEYRGETFIEIDDLTARFDDPAVMDVKMGTRTFLESEVKNPVLRSDLYLKMTRIDPTEPSPEEHAAQALTKLRYMQFRERESSTAAFGFRVEAIKLPGAALAKGFQKTRTREEVMGLMLRFLQRRSAREPLLKRLRTIRDKIPTSHFFRTHEVIGSSLLLMYDDKSAGVWMIDFAKALPVDADVDHRRAWALGNHEDGYLSGLDNLIQILEDSAHQDLHSHV